MIAVAIYANGLYDCAVALRLLRFCRSGFSFVPSIFETQLVFKMSELLAVNLMRPSR